MPLSACQLAMRAVSCAHRATVDELDSQQQYDVLSQQAATAAAAKLRAAGTSSKAYGLASPRPFLERFGVLASLGVTCADVDAFVVQADADAADSVVLAAGSESTTTTSDSSKSSSSSANAARSLEYIVGYPPDALALVDALQRAAAGKLQAAGSAAPRGQGSGVTLSTVAAAEAIARALPAEEVQHAGRVLGTQLYTSVTQLSANQLRDIPALALRFPRLNDTLSAFGAVLSAHRQGSESAGAVAERTAPRLFLELKVCHSHGLLLLGLLWEPHGTAVGQA